MRLGFYNGNGSGNDNGNTSCSFATLQCSVLISVKYKMVKDHFQGQKDLLTTP